MPLLHGYLMVKVLVLATAIIVCGLTTSDDKSENVINAANKTQLKYEKREPRQCPCQQAQYCERIKHIPEKEVFIFSVSNNNWLHYDWTRVTSIVMMSGYNDSLMCFAHSKGVRVLSVANMAVTDLTNQTVRHAWVQQHVDMVTDNFLDGINVDFESVIEKNDQETRDGLNTYISELNKAVKASFPHTMISVDFAWSPDGIDSRFYDYKMIAEVVDLVFVMSYDERSQIYGDCVGWANSGFNNTSHGLDEYLGMIPANKLILGVPWYGYQYTCTSYDQINQRCALQHVPFRGVNCSDAVGHQVDYQSIIKVHLPQSFTGRLWDQTARSPYFTVKDSDSGEISQFWYDDPSSLSIKYNLAQHLSLRGVGMWNADCLDYNDQDMVRDMWSIIPRYT